MAQTENLLLGTAGGKMEMEGEGERDWWEEECKLEWEKYREMMDHFLIKATLKILNQRIKNKEKKKLKWMKY